MKNKKAIGKYQWCLGFLGFLGFAGFLKNFDGSQATTFYLFFAFFSFFGSYWEYKLQQEKEDERLIENRLRANSLSFRVSLLVIWIGAVLTNTVLPRFFTQMKSVQNRYSIALIFIGFGFAVGIILQSYLTYKYDTEE